MKTIYLGSRDKLCINKELREEVGHNAMQLTLGCKRLGLCCKYNKTDSVPGKNTNAKVTQSFSHDSLDIKDLLNFSRKVGICPFMHS